MVQATLMEGQDESVVRCPSVVDQEPCIGRPQHHHRLLVTSPRQYGVHGHLRTHRHMQPLQPPAHLPAGLVHDVHQVLPRRLHQPGVGRRRLVRHPGQCPTQPTATHLQPKPVGEHLPRVSQRQSHLLVQHRRQRQGLRPQLHAAYSCRLGRLQRMSTLHPPATLTAVAYSDVKTAHHRASDDLFLILRFVALQFDPAATVGALFG